MMAVRLPGPQVRAGARLRAAWIPNALPVDTRAGEMVAQTDSERPIPVVRQGIPMVCRCLLLVPISSCDDLIGCRRSAEGIVVDLPG